MNTNTIHALSATAAIGLIAGFVGMAISGNILAGAAIGVSYLTVVALIVMTASDYRSRPKAYVAAPLVTGHFQQAKPKSTALHTPRAKARMAA